MSQTARPRRSRPRANARGHRREPASSPFPPIGDYAFLSDCHTGALVAPNGTIEWLCAPRFDSPSIFGALLDRGAGGFRLGPYGTLVPGSRRYEPGTNIVETTWMTQSGWLVVRDALTIGPWSGSSDPASHTRPPTDCDADRVLVRTVAVHPGQRAGRVDLRAGVRLRARHRRLGGDRRRLPRSRRDRRHDDSPPHERHVARDRGQPCAGTPHARGRRDALLRALLGEGAARAEQRRGGDGDARPHVALLARLGRRRALPRPSLAHLPAALSARAEGAHVRADRRDGRCAHDLAAGDARRRAQLGLPLHLDARRDLHAVGPARARARLGGRRLHAVRRRRRSQRRRLAADHVRDRRRADADRADARPPDRLRGREAGADRQRSIRPAPERRLWRRARLRLPAHEAGRAAAAAAVAGARGAGEGARSPSGSSPTRGSGRRAASRATTSPRS